MEEKQMENQEIEKMKNEGMKMIKQIAALVVHQFKEGLKTEANRSWDQLKGCAYMYVKVFGSDDGFSGFHLANNALSCACVYEGLDPKVIHDYIAW